MKKDIFVLDKSNVHVFRLLFQEPIEKWFDDDKVGFGMMCDGKPAALLLASFTVEYVWIDWIYVQEEFRGRGLSFDIVNAFLRNISGIVHENTAFVSCEDELLKSVLMRVGFDFDEEPVRYTYSSNLSKLTGVPEHKPSNMIKLLNKLNEVEISKLSYAISECRDVGVKLPVNPNDYLRESLVYMENDKVKAVLLLSKDGSGISVSYAYLSGVDGKPLIKLIAAAKKLLENSYGADTTITMTTLNKESEKLLTHLFPDADRVPMWTGVMNLNLF